MGIFRSKKSKTPLPLDITESDPDSPGEPPLEITLKMVDDAFVTEDGARMKVEGSDAYAAPTGRQKSNDPWGRGLRSVYASQVFAGDHRIFLGRVAGVTHHRKDANQPCFGLGQPVRVEREPKQSATAIRVVCGAHGGAHKAGYLPHELTQELAEVVNDDSAGQAVVTKVFREGGNVAGLRVLGSFGRSLTFQLVD